MSLKNPDYIIDGITEVKSVRKSICGKMQTQMTLKNEFGELGRYRLLKADGIVYVWYHQYDEYCSKMLGGDQFDSQGRMVAQDDNYDEAMHSAMIHCRYSI